MKTVLLSALIVLHSAAAASAYTEAGIKYTSGAGGYGGVSSFAEWGDDVYYFRPSVNTYKSDASDRYTSYSFGSGLDGESWSAGAELSITPETGGYRNSSIYADLSYNLLPLPEVDAMFQDAGIGVFTALTGHEDSFSLSTSVAPGGTKIGCSVGGWGVTGQVPQSAGQVYKQGCFWHDLQMVSFTTI